jgi:hypothetical protein
VPYLVTGNAGLDMTVPHYLPGLGHVMVTTTKTTTTIVAHDTGTGDQFEFTGVFSVPDNVFDTAGTITSLTVYSNARASVLYQFANLNMRFGPTSSFGSYLSFATRSV